MKNAPDCLLRFLIIPAVVSAAVMPFEALNMIIGSGILGLVTAFVFHWPIPLVYLTLSLEERIRFAVSLVIFKRRG